MGKGLADLPDDGVKSMEYIVGLDVGTTNIKAAAYDLSGDLFAFATRKTVTHHPRPEWSEYDPEELWGSVASCLREISAGTGAGNIKAIGVASMAEAGVGLDSRGKPVYPIISWFDLRAEYLADELAGRMDKETLYSITGQFMSGKYGIGKLMWIARNRPEAFESVYKWLSVSDYILYRLSGEYATDYSLASRTAAFDITGLDWSRRILDTAGFSKDIMPRAYPGGTVVGHTSRVCRDDTGINPGVPVVTGGHDHACAAVAMDIFEPGVLLDSMGTAEAAITAVERPVLTKEAYESGICIYPHCGKRLYRAITSIQACGALVEWFIAKFGNVFGSEAVTPPADAYEHFFDLAAKAGNDAGGIYFIPYLRGLVEQPSAKGAFIGVTDRHGAGDFAHALIEGVTFELKRRIRTCEKLFGSDYGTVRIVGGATRSEYWMDLKTNVLGKAVQVPENNEATCCGAALLGGMGARLVEGDADLRRFNRVKTEYRPDAMRKDLLAEKYLRYLDIRSTLLELYEKYKEG